MLTMIPETFNFPRPATYDTSIDYGVSHRQLPIMPSNARSSVPKLLDIVDKFLCFGRDHLLAAVNEYVTYS